jgi:anti-sigma factor RsiW
MIDERLIVLLDAYLDGGLSPEEKKELERMLLESDAARRCFWERTSLHGWTYAAAKLNYSAKPAPDLHGVSFAAFLRGLWRAFGKFPWKVALAGAACVIAVMLWGRFYQSRFGDEEDLATDAQAEPAVTNSIATLTRGAAVVWEHETNSVEIGSLLSPGWLQLKSGAVQIEFYSGARVILQGPAEL